MGQPQPKNHYTEEEMRREIIRTVARLDKSFLRVVHSMMRTYSEEIGGDDDTALTSGEDEQIIDYTIDGTPIRENEFFEAADKGVEKVLNGGGTPADEFFKKKEEWLKSIE